jgi:uncharacterized protein YbjT (DUF2867 family)
LLILLTGASGFIGRHIAEALVSRHRVICAVRNPGGIIDERLRGNALQADFLRDTDPAVWLPRLKSVDVVINAVGIIREQGVQTFDALHRQAPCALFTACASAGVKLVIQISALGADEHARSCYHLSKKAADDFLAGLPLASVIVQPSLVFGADGASARLFGTMAALPLIPLPGNGGQMIQPVHVGDVVAAIGALVDCLASEQSLPTGSRTLPVAGPQPMTLRTYLSTLRTTIGLGRARFLPMPMPLVRMGAKLGSALPGGLLDPETLQMLERGNTADASAIQEILGRPPRSAAEFIGREQVPSFRLRAQLDWLLPMLSVSIALVWIITGIVSLGLYPVEESYALLARVGITGMLAPVMLYGAALMDIGFGIATLVMRRRRLLWLAQLAAILFYTAIISWRLPEFWLHPYGPLLKNLPMLAAIWMLLQLEEK